MDLDKQTTSSEWLPRYGSLTDLSIILRVSVEYAKSNTNKHTPFELIELYKVCHEIASYLEEQLMEKIVCKKIGILSYRISRCSDALKYFKEVLRICQDTGDIAGEGKSYCNIGIVYKSLGQYQEAMENHKKHLRICQDTGDIVGEGKAYGNIGIVYESLGQYQEAMEYHKKCLRICQDTGNIHVAGEGKSYCNIGIVYKSLGQYQEAMEYHKKHLRICQETGDIAGEGKSYCNIGNVYQSLGQYQEAMEYHKKHLRICQDTGDIAGEGTSYGNIGYVYYMYGDLQEGEGNFRKSLCCREKVFKSLHQQDDYKVSIVDTYIKLYHLLTSVLVESGKQEEALLVSERGRSQALRDLLIMKYGFPTVEKDGSLPIEDINSLVSSSNSTFLFLSLSSDTLLIFVIEQGKYLRLKKQSQDSFAFCKSSDCLRVKLQDTLKLYMKKVIKDANEHIRANPTHLLEDRSMDDDQDRYHDQRLALDDCADNLAGGTTTKEEVFVENTTTRMSIYRGESTEYSDEDRTSEPKAEQTQTKQSQAVFGATTPECKHEVQSEFSFPSNKPFHEGGDDAFSRHATLDKQVNEDQNRDNLFNGLYQVLIAPVEEALTKPEIIIIPDGALFFVPFAALKNKGQPFLSETKRIRIGPSLTTLKLLKECPVEKHCKTGALIVGGPIAGEVLFRGEKRKFNVWDLPFAREEALMIGYILDERPLLGSLATKDEVMRSLQEGVRIIHIATHGDATTGELLLAPGPCAGKEIPDEEDYMLTVKDIYSCGINSQLVVLSCCHSGRGEIKAEGVVGLTRAFLAAGARSVLASLWGIDDAATSYFMRHFYENLKNGESACASLQQAMTEMRKTREWSHPYYWAPFFIVGDDITITT